MLYQKPSNVFLCNNVIISSFCVLLIYNIYVVNYITFSIEWARFFKSKHIERQFSSVFRFKIFILTSIDINAYVYFNQLKFHVIKTIYSKCVYYQINRRNFVFYYYINTVWNSLSNRQRSLTRNTTYFPSHRYSFAVLHVTGWRGWIINFGVHVDRSGFLNYTCTYVSGRTWFTRGSLRFNLLKLNLCDFKAMIYMCDLCEFEYAIYLHIRTIFSAFYYFADRLVLI